MTLRSRRAGPIRRRQGFRVVTQADAAYFGEHAADVAVDVGALFADPARDILQRLPV